MQDRPGELSIYTPDSGLWDAAGWEGPGVEADAGDARQDAGADEAAELNQPQQLLADEAAVLNQPQHLDYKPSLELEYQPHRQVQDQRKNFVTRKAVNSLF